MTNKNIERFVHEPVLNVLTTMMANKKIDVDTQLDIYLAVKKAVQEFQNFQVEILNNKVSDWESAYGEADKTLYALGLRHSIDILTDVTATDLNGFNDKPYVEGQEFKLDEIVEDI